MLQSVDASTYKEKEINEEIFKLLEQFNGQKRNIRSELDMEALIKRAKEVNIALQTSFLSLKKYSH